MTAGRNDPCPCGSGRKYKKCHLSADQAATAAGQDHTVSPLHAMDNQLAEKMAAFAASRFPEELDVSGEFPSLETEEDGLQFLLPWSIYIAPLQGRPLVDWFLQSRSWSLSAGEVEWIEAQRRSWLSVWDVLEVQPGRGLRLRDLLTLEERFVHEVKGSISAQPHLLLLCRVVDAGSISVIAGLHPQPLLPRDGNVVLHRIRAAIRKKGKVPVDLLRQPEIASIVAHAWDDAVQEIHQRPAPELRNTDGDDLLLSTETYGFDPSRRAEVEAALATIKNMHRDAPDCFSLMRTDTILGTVSVSDGKLRIETNSVKRADKLCVLVKDACGSLLGTGVRSYTDPRAAMGRGKSEPRRAASEEEAEVIRNFKRKHYEQWLKDRIPALDNKTPRQAARSKRGREQLETLLSEIEYHESLLPEAERFDISVLRTKLGLEL